MHNFRHSIFTKFGIMCEIAPFLGFYEQWRYLLKGICKSTSAFWNEYENAFLELDETWSKQDCGYRTRQVLANLLKECEIDQKAKLNRVFR